MAFNEQELINDVAGIMSDRLVDMLADSELLPGGEWDTTLVDEEPKGPGRGFWLILTSATGRREDGRRVVRITVDPA